MKYISHIVLFSFILSFTTPCMHAMQWKQLVKDSWKEIAWQSGKVGVGTALTAIGLLDLNNNIEESQFKRLTELTTPQFDVNGRINFFNAKFNDLEHKIPPFCPPPETVINEKITVKDNAGIVRAVSERSYILPEINKRPLIIASLITATTGIGLIINGIRNLRKIFKKEKDNVNPNQIR